ncbi:radical SAM family heme chaperone HemW [Enterovirga rhinocerotis]|uniref:Heme chaperone HemW n=1 Tax=Enterovirga rhinocerotis TaxID=1339210 RepID=A0A4R7BWC4_9HYPH|nr:radical SAM family heme chaperone HemW [Enterovirga rhinocerotis]TDR90170.1 oxygen-independent coproporphyrinogen-3 oxidase [Enterovirga rhinocerotis]
MIRHPTQDAGFGVYVHWPFCQSKCPYCDFNSHVRTGGIDEERYLDAFRREIAHAGDMAPGRTVTSIFLGGGTPSLMRPQTTAGLLEAIATSWTIARGAEITLEANPTSVEAERFRGYRAAGVNRVSMGIQALNDGDLRRLGRLHSVAEALAAVDVARRHFPRYSFDLIYARPDQTPAAWKAELERAIGEAADHLSLYQLTIEPGTWFERLHAAGKLAIPDPELSRILYDVTQEVCDRAGLPAYEISNHARPGAESRHNLLYWRYGEYAGVGPGAHGRIMSARGRTATATERSPEDWLARVERHGHGLVEQTVLTREEAGDEFLLMGLRLREGIEPSRYRTISGRMLDHERIQDLLGYGMIAHRAGSRIAVTPAGFPVLDSVVADLAA